MIPDRLDRERLLVKARSLLEFLESRRLAVEIEERAQQTVVAYVGHPLSFEAALDWRDGAAFVLVARSPDGHRPGGYYVNGNGRRVRLHLIEALSKAGLLTADKERRLKGAMSKSGAEAMATQLTTLLTELRENLDALVGRADAIFA